MTKQSWFKTNIKEVSNDFDKPFTVEWNLYKFKPLTFKESTEFTINELTKRHQTLYVAFSGGYDSTYIVEQLFRHKVDFVPVIVDNPWTTFELEYAYYWCNQHKIKPLVLSMNETDYIQTFADVFKKWGNCNGIAIIPVIYAGLKLRDKGNLVTGTTILDDGKWNPKLVKLFCSWDYYYELFDLNFELFFMDNLEIVDSILNSIQDKHTRTDYFKSELYQLPYMPKFTIVNQNLFQTLHNKIAEIPNQREKVNDAEFEMPAKALKRLLEKFYI